MTEEFPWGAIGDLTELNVTREGVRTDTDFPRRFVVTSLADQRLLHTIAW